MADTPFFRGVNRMDWCYAVGLQAAADQNQTDAVRALGGQWGYEASARFTFPAEWGPSVSLVRTAPYLFVCVGSTSNVQQWVFHFLGSPAVHFDSYPGRVSAYFGLTAIAAQLAVLPLIREWGAGRKLVLIGFSFGAAVVELLKSSLAAEGLDAACIAFGCPRPGLQDFADPYPTDNLSRFILVNDPVGSVPPQPWAATGARTGWIPSPPLVDYVQPGDGWTLGLGGALTPGDWSMSLTDLILSYDRGLWQQIHNAYLYARELRRPLPETLADGFAGYPQASKFDPAMAAIFGPSQPWPWAYPAALPSPGVPEMVMALSVYFRDNSGPALGFQEVYYFLETDPQALINWWKLDSGSNPSPQTLRLAFASQQVEIFALRAGLVQAAGGRASKFEKYPAGKKGVGSNTDTIEDCVRYFGFSVGGVSKRQFHFRGTPYDWLDGDNLSPKGESLLPRIDAYLAALKTKGLQMFLPAYTAKATIRGATQAVAGGDIVLTLDAAVTWASNSAVRVSNSRNAPLLNGVWKIATAGGAVTSIILTGSGRYSAPANMTGNVRQITGPSQVAVDSFSFDGSGSKKTGRPGFSQRGRRSPQLRRR